MSDLPVLRFDRHAAGALHSALQAWLRMLEANDKPEPPGLADLAAWTRELGTRRGEFIVAPLPGMATHADTEATPDMTGADDGQVLTQRETAERWGVSARTVSRRIDSGELGHVVEGGRRRVSLAAIENYELKRGRMSG